MKIMKHTVLALFLTTVNVCYADTDLPVVNNSDWVVTLKQSHDHKCVNMSKTTESITLKPGQSGTFKIAWDHNWHCDASLWAVSPYLSVNLYNNGHPSKTFPNKWATSCSVYLSSPDEQTNFVIINNSSLTTDNTGPTYNACSATD